MKQFYMLISLLFIINYGFCRNILPYNLKRQTPSVGTESYIKVGNESKSYSNTTTQNLLKKVITLVCHNNTCSLDEKNESIPTSSIGNGESIKLDDLLHKQFKDVKISKLKIPIFELEKETFGPNIVHDFVSGAQDIKGRITKFGEIIKSHFVRRSESGHEDREEIFDIDNVLQTFKETNKNANKSIYIIFLTYDPEKTTYDQTTDSEHNILEMEESKFLEVIHSMEEIGINYGNLQEYFRSKMVPTSTFEMSTKDEFKKNKHSKIAQLKDEILVVQAPASKIKVKKDTNVDNQINEFVSNDDPFTTQTKAEGNATNENGNSTQYKQTKPYFLIVTLPTATCWGVVVIFLCYCMRSGGWCCNLFKDVIQDEESSND